MNPIPRIALVTGGGQGIGLAIGRRLADAGFHVVVNDLDETRAAEAADGLRSAGGSASHVAGDVSKSEQVDVMFSAVEAEHGTVTALINNAGIGGNAGIRNASDAFWGRVISVDLNGVFYCTRRALAGMRDAGKGTVVSIASRAWLGWWGQSAYAAAKAGVIGMTRALAVEMASKEIRLNVVAPGLIDSPMLRDRSQEAFDRLLTSVPAGRLGAPEDVANAVAFLADVRSAPITGQVLYVCGGKSIYAYPDWSN